MSREGDFREASAKKKRAALRRLAAFLRSGNKMISPQHVRECVFAIKKCLEGSAFMESYRTSSDGDGGAEPTGAQFTWPPSDDDFVDAAAAAAVTDVGRVDDDCRLVTEAARAIAALAPYGEHLCSQAASGNASSLDSLTEGEEDEAEGGDEGGDSSDDGSEWNLSKGPPLAPLGPSCLRFSAIRRRQWCSRLFMRLKL